MQKVGEGVAIRHLVKEPLTFDELKAIAAKIGDPQALVAPKRRAEAEGLSGDRLLRWLAEDGGRVRRPIVVAGKKVTLGFTADVRADLEDTL